MQNTIIEENEESKKIIRKKTVKLKIKQIAEERTVSREFNDPIYAGLDQPNEMGEINHWDPWLNSTIAMKEGEKIKKQGFKLKQFNKFKPKIRQKRQIGHKEVLKNQVRPHPPQLPSIKQRTPSSLKEINFDSLEITKKVPSLSQLKRKNLQAKSLTRLDWKKPQNSMFKTPPFLENNSISKIGKVVYNYCYSNNDEECIFDYSKVLQRNKIMSIKNQQLKQQLRRTRGYWKISGNDNAYFMQKKKKS